MPVTAFWDTTQSVPNNTYACSRLSTRSQQGNVASGRLYKSTNYLAAIGNENFMLKFFGMGLPKLNSGAAKVPRYRHAGPIPTSVSKKLWPADDLLLPLGQRQEVITATSVADSESDFCPSFSYSLPPSLLYRVTIQVVSYLPLG